MVEDNTKYAPPKGKETIWNYLTQYKKIFILSSLGGIVYNTLTVLGPILTGHLLDATTTIDTKGFKLVYLTSAYFFIVTVFFQFARFIKRWFIRDHFNRVACDLRATLISRILSNDINKLEKEKIGDLMSRTINDIALVVETIRKTVTEIWDTWLLMLIYFITLLIIDWKITLIASIPIPFTILFAEIMRHPLYKYSLSLRKTTSKVTKGLQVSVSNITLLRLFGREEDEYRKIAQAFEEQAHWNIKDTLLRQSLLPIYSLIAGIGVVIVIALGGQKASSGDMSIGQFNSFLIIFIALATRTKTAAKVFNNWHTAKAAWIRIKEKMIEIEERKTKIEIPNFDSNILLCVDNLSFGFCKDNIILSDINFTLKEGEILGITGAIGSGKTALAHALTGLYPYMGSIKLCEKEIKDIDNEIRKNLILYTGHDQFLFSKSIQENITFSTKKIDFQLLNDVLTYSSLDGDIKKFDNEIDTIVGEKGVKLSGGQRQRIALARILYSNVKILILDDPFSAVDIATERKIIGHLRTIVKNKAIIIFSHRLLSFKEVDKIIVLEKGKIVQYGNHEHLYNIEGIYHDIFKAQSFLGGNNDEK